MMRYNIEPFAVSGPLTFTQTDLESQCGLIEYHLFNYNETISNLKYDTYDTSIFTFNPKTVSIPSIYLDIHTEDPQKADSITMFTEYKFILMA